MDQPIDIDPIVTKYLREEPLSPEEQTALQLWVSQGQGRSQMLENLKNDTNTTRTDLAHLQNIPGSRIWSILETRLQEEGYWKEADSLPLAAAPPARPLVRRMWWRYVMAASIILAVAGTAWYGLHHHSQPTVELASAPAQPSEITPGGSRATLTLSDGRNINLDSTGAGVLASQGNMQISKSSDGQLAYTPTSSTLPLATLFNVLTTPRAGQFSLSLPDGSKVWLNNASSLRYPIAFTGATREVELTGEAYFEVAKDVAHPFLVHTLQGPAGPSTIEVLGTSFNIMAYGDESAERATLVDGSIRYAHGNASALLKPEEQSVADAHGNIRTLHHVDIAEVTAWKNGYFHFDHASLETTMRQISRWYDITVEYQGAIPSQEFVGKIQHNMPLSSLLKGLEGEHVHFVLEGKKVVVKP